MEHLETREAAPPEAGLDALLAAQTPSLARRAVPWFVAILVLAGLGAAASLYASIERPLAVDVVEVKPGEVERTVASVAAGRVAARRRARVAGDLIGRVIAIHARKGERVTKGQLLVELDSREATAQLDMARHSRDAELASIEQTSARLEWARADLKRKRDLGPGVVRPDEEEHAASDVHALEAELAALKARAAEAEARISSAESLLDKHKVRAPFSGIMSELWVEVGEVTSTMSMPGSKSDVGSGRLFEIIDMDDLYVTAPIDEVDLARVTIGLTARVTLDPFPREPFLGTVTRIAPYVLDVEEQNRTVEVEVSIPSVWKGRELKPGISADVEVIVERKESANRLPAHVLLDGKRALVVTPGGAGGTESPHAAPGSAGGTESPHAAPGTKPGELRIAEKEVSVGVENWRFAEVDLPAGTLVVAGAAGDVRAKAGQLVTIRKRLDAETR